ncbi:MAG: DUF3089 domain-containing protein [Bacteroidia bacterium]
MRSIHVGLPCPGQMTRQTCFPTAAYTICRPAPLDVFFIHPTTWTYKPGRNTWNGPVWDPKFNQHTDEWPIRYQASLFNGVGRVFAPRYRQAHLHAYYAIEKSPEAPMTAFKLAYKDVATAFDYYLKITTRAVPSSLLRTAREVRMGIMLLKQFFDQKPLQNQLVAAYLVGMPVKTDTFHTIPPCSTATQTGCFCSWLHRAAWQKNQLVVRRKYHGDQPAQLGQ